MLAVLCMHCCGQKGITKFVLTLGDCVLHQQVVCGCYAVRNADLSASLQGDDFALDSDASAVPSGQGSVVAPTGDNTVVCASLSSNCHSASSILLCTLVAHLNPVECLDKCSRTE